MGKKIGIDLGTTYSCVSYVDENGAVRIVDNSEGKPTTPSVVFITGDSVVVGETARSEGGMNPENIIERVKNFMGDPNYLVNVEGTDYSPAAISKFILEKLVKDAKSYLGDEDIDGAVITCPAYFGDPARAATRLAGEQAGLNVLQILDEPTAAALSYGYSRHEDMQKTILIYDLGGGTFDCTVMKLDFVGDKRDMEVITTGGNHLLGGKDWDKQLTDYLVEEFCSLTGCDAGAMLEDPECIQWFSENTEKTKQLLSSKEKTPVIISYDGNKEKIEVTREKFDEITEGLLNQTIMLIDNMLNDAKLTMDAIDEIILVGGSTRMPQVKARLEQEYGKPLFSYEPDKAVAMGAALMANYANYATTKTTAGSGKTMALGGDSAPEDSTTTFTTPDGTEFNVKVKCTKSYGLICLDANNNRVVGNIIYKDSERPCREKRGFAASADGQTSVKLEVFENESHNEDATEEESTRLYEDATLAFDAPVNKGTPLDITFVMDKDGMLEIEMSVDGGPIKKVTPKRIGNDTNNVGMDKVLTLGS